MFKKIFVLLATTVLLVVGMPHMGHAQSAPRVTDCGRTTSALCWEAAKTGGALAQANIPMTCAEVFQNEPGYVLLVIYDAQGNWINQGNPRHHAFLPTHGVVCVGNESFVSKAETMIWCIDFRRNGHNTHARFRGRPIIAEYQSGRRRMVADLRWRPDLPQDTNPAWAPIPSQYVRPGG